MLVSPIKIIYGKRRVNRTCSQCADLEFQRIQLAHNLAVNKKLIEHRLEPRIITDQLPQAACANTNCKSRIPTGPLSTALRPAWVNKATMSSTRT